MRRNALYVCETSAFCCPADLLTKFTFIRLNFKMTKAKKVLFITQEITPYVPESSMSTVGRNLPQLIQEGGTEIRTFMPRWGIINERASR